MSNSTDTGGFKQSILKPVKRFINYFNRSESRLILILAVFIGVLGGFGAVGFRKLIDLFQFIFFGGGGENIVKLAQHLNWWQRVLIPTLGGLLLAPMIKLFSKECKGDGVPEVIESIAIQTVKIKSRTVITRSLASAISLASGGSVGREGPIIQIGAALGSAVGQFLHASQTRMKTLVGCGAAAGMAATFNAPLGGALFAVEVILGDFGLAQITPIVISSVTATAISRSFLGDYPTFHAPQYQLESYGELFLYAVLGIATAYLAWFFVRIVYKSEDFFSKIPLPEWIKPTIGGFVVGLIAIWLPHVYGTGYDTMNIALGIGLTLGLSLTVLVAKLAATAIYVGSGGSGGVFAPSMFIGSLLGSALGTLYNMAFPELTAPSGAYALAGMGAMIAGTMQAPITVILIIFELTNDYKIILPIMTACILSTLLTYKLLGGESIYTVKLIRRGVNIFRGRDLNVLRSLKVRDVMQPVNSLVSSDTTLNELFRLAHENPHVNYIKVDKDNRMSGIIPMQNIIEALRDDNLRDLLVAEDIAVTEYPMVEADESLDTVVKRYGDMLTEEIPVVDSIDSNVAIGILSQSDLLHAYQRQTIRQDLGSHIAGHLMSDFRPRQVELLGGFKMVEIEAPRQFVGKTLGELKLNDQYGVQVFSIKKTKNSQDKPELVQEELQFAPSGNDKIDHGDILVMVGKGDNLNKLISLT